jgi:hypothetical protein
MVASPPWTVPCARPQLVDQVHRISLSKINPELENPSHFAKNHLGFFVINPQSTKIPATSFQKYP